MKLQDAANYLKGGPPKDLPALIATIKRVLKFPQERANRLARYIVIVRAYENGEAVDRIADRYGCTRHTVQRYARLAGLPIRPKHLPGEIRRAVIRDYKAKVPIAQIALLHGVSQAYVSKMAGEEGILRRKYQTTKITKRKLRELAK